MAEKYKNAYFVGIFACCREIHIAKVHTNCRHCETLEEAKALYAAEDEYERKRLAGELNPEEEYEYLSKMNTRLAGYITNAEPAEQEEVEEKKTEPPSRGC